MMSITLEDPFQYRSFKTLSPYSTGVHADHEPQPARKKGGLQ